MMRFPSINDVSAELRQINKQDSADDGDDGGIDVRLQVLPDSTWTVNWGPSDYDQDHRGYWGSSSVPGDNRRFDSKDVAKDLIEQAREHKAMGGDVEEKTGTVREDDDDEEEEEDPDDDGEEDDAFSDEEMASGYVISDDHGSGFGYSTSGRYAVAHEHKFLGSFDDIGVALGAIEKRMKRENFFPNIYYVNDHGNVDLLDSDGNAIESRV